MIIHPPIDINKYEVQTNGEAIVLINLIKAKGAELFYQLAELMPEYKFIGVRGGYLVNRQIVPQDLPPNVEILPNTPNIQEVYKRAKIVLMPSEAESWGKVAIEACCSGIPVIANKTYGLNESLGNAGIFIDVNQPLLWVKKIKSLYRNQSFYTKRSNLCKKRAIELELIYKKQIEELNNNLEEIVRG
jgi:glycosyltransferase involved in cell wall biosynthesis